MRAAICSKPCTSLPCARHRCLAVQAAISDTNSKRTIRKATLQDVPTIRQRLLQEKMNPLGIDASNFTVVESSTGQLLAFAQLQPVAAAAGATPTFEFRSLVVDQQNRGQGIGSLLLQHLVSDCTHDIYLTTLAKTTPFYHKAGLNVLPPADIPKWLWFEVAAGTVALARDPGAFTGTGEAAYYLSNLQGPRRVPAGGTACADATVGRMMRQNVAVIVTGIGPTAAALCVYDVMRQCGGLIRDVFYSGTAGWSPQLGGVINNGTCSSANGGGNIVRIGDVCVSPFSVNWDCRKASWDASAQGFPNQCSFPEQAFGASSSELFGQCQFTDISRAQLATSDEVLAVAAARTNNLPTRSPTIQALDAAYWSSMSAGTNVSYPDVTQTTPPRVWSYKQCMEIDSQYFWSGAPWDMVARSYVADTLNKALRVSGYSQGNMIAVSAMEAIGLYAISTASAVVLSTLQSRCERLPLVSPCSSPVNCCSFTINYN
ncbi:hypothetical protein COO60DRAFT_1700592 [Scenedesmus sp. NREL 46B-D3]|nr:hypothetical protein COO60DRAFT_1700592 [Scenedesmus sp. NREL 46B-D3]